MLIGYKRGQGSVILRVKILNSSVSTGAGLTGLSSTSSGLIISTIADTESTATAYTVAASNVETITTNGTFAAPTAGKCRFKEVDSTNHKGVYEIQIADARFAVSGAKFLLVSIAGATNCAETDIAIPLRDLDPYDGVRAGLTALPNVASGSAGAIITSGTGTGQLSVSSGVASANTTQLAGQTVTAAAGVTFPTSIASPTNITAGTIATVTNGVTVSTNNDKTGYSLATAPPTAAAIADAVWDETIGDHLTGGSTGAALNAAGSAGDPWTTTLPGSYTGSQAGKILSEILVDTGTTLQGEVDDIQSRLPAALVSGRMDASVGAMAANTLTASALATDAASEVATAVRSELTTELGRIDEAVSSRMATFTLPTHFGNLEIAANGHVSAAVQSIANNSITASSIQGAALTAAKFATGAIDANALAADAASEVATATLTTAMTESYRAAGVAPTLAQTAFELLAHMGDSAITDLTKTLRKLDGTTAKTFTLDSATTPTSITEAT